MGASRRRSVAGRIGGRQVVAALTVSVVGLVVWSGLGGTRGKIVVEKAPPAWAKKLPEESTRRRRRKKGGGDELEGAKIVTRGRSGTALVMTAAVGRGWSGSETAPSTNSGAPEYGELKASFTYAVTLANKKRYCEVRGWTLVVGGDTVEADGRSARWNKVAWLRTLLPYFEWLVWMDLDTLFASCARDLVREVETKGADAHFTQDGDPSRVNTGVFAVRRSEWTRDFLTRVWDHADSGRGASDQNSFNWVLKSETDPSKVVIHPKPTLNAFPHVDFHPTQGFETPPPGDVFRRTLVLHFAGQYAGARASDGQTPPTMLVQFLDAFLKAHLRFLKSSSSLYSSSSSSSSSNAVVEARETLAPCLDRIRAYAERAYDAATGIGYFVPGAGQAACDADAALRAAKPRLAALLPPGVADLTCSRPRWPPSVRGLPTTTTLDRPPRAFSLAAGTGFRLSVPTFDCAYLSVDGDGAVTIADETRAVDLGKNDPADDDAALSSWKRHDASFPTTTTTKEVIPELGKAIILGPIPSRKRLFPPPELALRQKTRERGSSASGRLSEVVGASYFWRFLGPLALTCLAAAPDARLVIIASPDDEFAPFAADDDDWRRLDVPKPLFLFPEVRRSERGLVEPLLYADHASACRFVAADQALNHATQGQDQKESGLDGRLAVPKTNGLAFREKQKNTRSGSTTYADARDLAKIAASQLGRLGRALSASSYDLHPAAADDPLKPHVVVVCGAPGGFRDCDAVVDAAKAALGTTSADVRPAHRFHRQDEPAWHALAKRRFLPPDADVVLFPRVSERFDVAPLLAASCVSRSAVLLQLNRGGPPSPPGYSFTQTATDALGLSLVTLDLPKENNADLAAGLASGGLVAAVRAAADRRRVTTSLHAQRRPDDDDASVHADIPSISSSSRRRSPPR